MAFALGLVDGGADPVAVLLDVVAPAQQQVGQRWADGSWTVAHEHAATAISEAVTVAVGARIPVPVTPRGHVVLACAEREWHGLPARLVGYTLQAASWRTTFLGASTSPQQFARFLDDVDADAVAISCSVAASLPAARRLVGAAREAGLPVLVGGGAFGVDDTRARALGASAWAPDARGAVKALDALVDLPTEQLRIARHASADDHAELVIRFAEFRSAARHHWLSDRPTWSPAAPTATDTGADTDGRADTRISTGASVRTDGIVETPATTAASAGEHAGAKAGTGKAAATGAGAGKAAATGAGADAAAGTNAAASAGGNAGTAAGSGSNASANTGASAASVPNTGADTSTGMDADDDTLHDDALDHALHALSAALLTDDPRMLREASDWLTALFEARGRPATAVPSLWRSLHRTVGEPLPEAARHLKSLN